MEVNTEALKGMLAAFRDDPETLNDIEKALQTFETYHGAIAALEIKKRVWAGGGLEPDEYRETVSRLDHMRTVQHNAVLTQVRLLNRIAAEAGLPPFYEGVVSEERPYRREVADAVLAFVRRIITERS